MLTNEEARARVDNGAAHLDTVKPGWFNRIDVGTLTLHDACGCIVGQLCGLESLGYLATGEPFSEGVRQLFGSSYLGECLGVFVEDCCSDDDEHTVCSYDVLQDAWIAAIADRLLSQAQATSPSLDAVVPDDRRPMSGVRA